MNEADTVYQTPAHSTVIARTTGPDLISALKIRIARVSLDGRDLGLWEKLLGNHGQRRLDDSFRIPARRTHDRDTLHIELAPAAGAAPWNAALYQALSWVPPFWATLEISP